MVDLPTSFPSDATAELTSIVLSGNLLDKQETAFKCGWNILGWGGNVAFDDKSTVSAKAALTEDQREQLTALRDALNRPQAAAFGDGSLLKLLLPLLLQLAGKLLG